MSFSQAARKIMHMNSAAAVWKKVQGMFVCMLIDNFLLNIDVYNGFVRTRFPQLRFD